MWSGGAGGRAEEMIVVGLVDGWWMANKEQMDMKTTKREKEIARLEREAIEFGGLSSV